MFLDHSFWKYPVLLHCYSGVGVVCSGAQLQLRALLVALQSTGTLSCCGVFSKAGLGLICSLPNKRLGHYKKVLYIKKSQVLKSLFLVVLACKIS